MGAYDVTDRPVPVLISYCQPIIIIIIIIITITCTVVLVLGSNWPYLAVVKHANKLH
jgi:hypothetical protein